MVSAVFNFDVPAIQRELDAVGRQVLLRAVAQQLDDVAFLVRNKVTDEIRRSVDRPRPFTLRPMKVTKAKWRDGDSMFSSVDMQPAQASYLWFPITGETRRPGDPGTARNDILSFSAAPTAYGGAFNKSVFKRLSKKAKDETTRRAALRAQRAALRGTGRLPRSLKWVSASRNAPGLFWGAVSGTHGLWQRPAASQPGSRLRLLLAFQPIVRTPVTIHYDAALTDGYDQQMTEVNFARVLQDKKTWWINRT